jgi:hypothetical protein
VGITGHLVQSFTNVETGTSITRNVSGPATITLYPDGSVSAEGRGVSSVALSKEDVARLGVPGLVFTSGHVFISFDSTGAVQRFTVSGTRTDGCALLGA